MRVTLKTEGGFAYFPGLAKPTTYDTDTLPPDQADELRQRVAAADFFNQPAVAAPPPPGSADYRTYTLTVEDGSHTHTARFTDLTPDPALHSLLAFVHGLRPAPGTP